MADMHKDATYKEKLIYLEEWLPAIIEAIKKDVKNEHLKQDFQFLKKYFPGKNLNKIEAEELSRAYKSAIAEEENGESIAEFIASRWIMKNSDIYYFFENFLSSVDQNFTEIEVLEQGQAEKLMQSASQEFGAPNAYVFSVLNSVALNQEQLSKFKESARHQAKSMTEERAHKQEQETLESLKNQHERELARLTDKYEKKLAGMQRKYTQDVQQLKKQIANLQKKTSS